MVTLECGSCGGITKEASTTDVIILEGCKIIIDNVPCYTCDECDEKQYLDNVLENIEKITNTLDNNLGAIIYLNYILAVTKVA